MTNKIVFCQFVAAYLPVSIIDILVDCIIMGFLVDIYTNNKRGREKYIYANK